MDKKPYIAQKFGFRYGLVTLLIGIALFAVLFSVWNPFRRDITIDDFLEIPIGQTRETIVERLGKPNDVFDLNRGTVLAYEVNIGKVLRSKHAMRGEGAYSVGVSEVWLYFHDDKLDDMWVEAMDSR